MAAPRLGSARLGSAVGREPRSACGPSAGRSGLAAVGPGCGNGSSPPGARGGGPGVTVPFPYSHGSQKEGSANQRSLSAGPEISPEPGETCRGFEEHLQPGTAALGACQRRGGAVRSPAGLRGKWRALRICLAFTSKGRGALRLLFP